MPNKNKTNELHLMLADLNNLISHLETRVSKLEEKATDDIHQLLYAYEIKLNILNNL